METVRKVGLTKDFLKTRTKFENSHSSLKMQVPETNRGFLGLD